MNRHTISPPAELSTRLAEATLLPAVAGVVGLVVAIIGGAGAFLSASGGGLIVHLFAALAVLGGLGGVIAVAAFVVVVRRRLDTTVSTPMAGILAAVTQASLDDFRTEVPASGVSELREIAASFNHMLRLQRRQEHLNQTALDAVASRQQVATEAAMLHQQAEEASLRDGLTGLFNRRKLDIDLAAGCERSLAAGAAMSYVMVDIDFFKKFNDTHGHQGGDELLRQMGELLWNAAPPTASCYRYGGEEFALILRGTPADGACVMIDRLRARIQARFIELGTPVTASFGVAGLSEHGVTAQELIGAADAALYVAKTEGRNRVILASPRLAAP